jgi:hypothetical protein
MVLSLWTALPLQASAAEVTPAASFTDENGIMYFSPRSDAKSGSLVSGTTINAAVTGYVGNSDTIEIPDSVTIGGVSRPVAIIGAGAFAACESLKSVTIPDSVVRVADKAFYNCPLLTLTVDMLPKTVTLIGADAFGKDENAVLGISGDYRYSIADGKATLWDYAGDAAVPEIPDKINVDGTDYPVTTVGSGTFYGHISLETVEIPNTVTDIGSYAFNASGLESIEIPDNVQSIGLAAFAECASLTEVKIPENIQSISGFLFYNCGSLTSIKLPESVTEIGDYTFANCSMLTSVNIPSQVKVLGTNLFEWCALLTSIEIPDGVTTIGDRVFYRCEGLTSLVIPDSVQTIGTNAFISCTGITDVTVPSSVFTKGFQAVFTSNNQIVSVTISDSVEAIPENAFKDMVSLTTINIPNSVETIGNDAFSGCTNITDITVPSSVLGSGEGGDIGTVFAASKDKITTVIIANGVEEIPAGAFDGLTNLETIVLPDSVKSIAAGAFPDVESLTEITIPDGAEIGEGVLPEQLGDLKIWCYNGSDAQTAAGENAVVMIESIKLNKTSLALNFSDNKSAQLSASVDSPTPASVTVGTPEEMPEEITWKSSNEDVAVVTDGKVEARGYGTAKITATIIPHSGATLSAVCTVTIAAPAPPAPTTYAVTVNSGTGGGSYEAGAKVSISANAPADGKVFDKWMTTDEDVNFANATSATTTFIMPAKAVTVTANYKDDSNSGGDEDPGTDNPPDNPPAADSDWVYEDGTWKYLVNGEVATGWIHDGKAWYYLNASGVMQTGWIHDGKAWYYLAGNGAMKTGWVKDNGSWYCLSGNGAMIASKWFKDTDGSWYYLSGNGKMLTGKHKIGAKAYSFKSNGVWIG